MHRKIATLDNSKKSTKSKTIGRKKLVVGELVVGNQKRRVVIGRAENARSEVNGL